MYWLRNKKNNFQLHTLIWGPASKQVLYETMKTQMKCRIIISFVEILTGNALKYKMDNSIPIISICMG